MTSTSAGCIVAATTRGIASRMSSRERAGSGEARTCFRIVRLRRRSVIVASRYITASTIPQAVLQPSAPISMSRTSLRSAVATLSVPVNVSAMMMPKTTPETRSIGDNGAAGITSALAG